MSALINSVKNCMVGEFIRTSDMDNNKNVELVGAFIIFVVTFPTLVSIFIWNGTYNFYNVPSSNVQDGKVVADETSQQDSKQEHVNAVPENSTEVENAIVDSTDTDTAGPDVHWTTYFFTVHPSYITAYIMHRLKISKKPQMQEEEIHLITSVAQPLLQVNTNTCAHNPTYTVYSDKSHCDIIHKRPEIPNTHVDTRQ